MFRFQIIINFIKTLEGIFAFIYDEGGGGQSLW